MTMNGTPSSTPRVSKRANFTNCWNRAAASNRSVMAGRTMGPGAVSRVVTSLGRRGAHGEPDYPVDQQQTGYLGQPRVAIVCRPVARDDIECRQPEGIDHGRK